jgi:hypothetical protein
LSRTKADVEIIAKMGSALSTTGKLEHDREKPLRHLEKHYNGRHGWSDGKRYRKPQIEHLGDRIHELSTNKDEGYQKRAYLNPNFEEKEKYPDLDTYYSTAKEIPRRLVVQATDDAIRQGDAHRNWGVWKIRGHVPTVIKLTELCLNPLGDEQYDGADEDESENGLRGGGKRKLPAWRVVLHWVLSTFYVLTLGWIIQVILAIQLVTAPWNDDGDATPYEDYDNVDWYWPKHAINPLDQSPENKMIQSEAAYLNLPRRLVVKDKDEENKWETRQTEHIRNRLTGVLQPYIFLSYSRASFVMSDEQRHEYLHRVAKAMIARENRLLQEGDPRIEAFWLDMDCIPKKHEASQDEITKHVHSICDAVRGAVRVYIVLRGNTAREKEIFGQRVWTLPEVLLGAGKTRYCFPSPVEEGKTESSNLLLTDMYDSFWPSHEDDRQSPQGAEEERDPAMSMLVKHYSNSLKLSDLQLFSYAVQALGEKGTGRANTVPSVDVGGYTQAATAYAAMGLVTYRINPDGSENNFQAIARLSLVNDSDQLLERLACLWPAAVQERDNDPGLLDSVAGSEKILRHIAQRDQFYTHLWDIKPLCQVVGVGDDADTPTIILDRCRAIPIRWKNFPRLRYANELKGFRATISSQVVYYGCWLLAAGFSVFWSAIPLAFAVEFSNQPINSDTADSNGDSVTIPGSDFVNVPLYLVGAAVLFFCSWIMSLFAPLAVRQLCNGGAKDSSCHLVGFEGTMPLRDIEVAMYGNFNRRLRYAPSSTPFSKDLRDPKIRAGNEPTDWEALRRRLPPGHRFFTIIDTGDNKVSLIAAERPPVVALICGREGGMVRSLLCSWRFENNCLYRENVMRMRSSIEDLTTPKDWLKISLASQGEVNRMRLYKFRQSGGPAIGGTPVQKPPRVAVFNQ